MIHSVVSIDPGIDRCGVAQFQADRLVYAGWIGNPDKSQKDPLARAHTTAKAVMRALETANFLIANVVIEWPRIYAPGKSKAPGESILLLAAVAGAVATNLKWLSVACGIEAVYPDAWKGQLPDQVTAGRVVSRLELEERQILSDVLNKLAQGNQNHVTDAVGIGLHALGRFEQAV